jgi:hypothetical protein
MANLLPWLDRQWLGSHHQARRKWLGNCKHHRRVSTVATTNKELANAERSAFMMIPEKRGDNRFAFAGRLPFPGDPERQVNVAKKGLEGDIQRAIERCHRGPRRGTGMKMTSRISTTATSEGGRCQGGRGLWVGDGHPLRISIVAQFPVWWSSVVLASPMCSHTDGTRRRVGAAVHDYVEIHFPAFLQPHRQRVVMARSNCEDGSSPDARSLSSPSALTKSCSVLQELNDERTFCQDFGAQIRRLQLSRM